MDAAPCAADVRPSRSIDVPTHVSVAPGVMTALGGAPTVTEPVTVAVPQAFVTRRKIECAPAVVKAYDGVGRVASVRPSPSKSHAHDVGGPDDVSVKCTVAVPASRHCGASLAN